MEEKERYTIESFEIDEPSCIFDNKTQQRILSLVGYNYNEIIDLEDLLNQQDKRIKELENLISLGNQKISDFYLEKVNELDKEYNEHLEELIKQYDELNKKYCEQQDELINVKEENQQLKQQLHDLSKKIVKEISFIALYYWSFYRCEECGNLTHLMTLTKSDFDEILDTILKKYGG